MNTITNHTKTILLCIVLLSFCGLNPSKANAQGPNAPEAASFEPVDATDMVNLVTGDLSYVLPLLNIPSPEGGYPIALSYHAGIAMEQEASWVGLGWSLNPGAINRSVNGFPDDWGNTTVKEFFYDEGWSENHYSFTIGGTLPNGMSIGVSSSWGSNKSFGGTVSLGYAGIVGTIGTKGQGGGIGIGSGLLNAGVNTSGFNFGIAGNLNGIGAKLSYSSNSGVGGSLNKSGLGINYNSNTGLVGSMSGSIGSLGISLSSNGVVSLGLSGVGSGSYISNSSEKGDLSIKTKGLNLDFGFFHVGYSHTKVDYSLFSIKKLQVSGILYPYESKKNIDGTYYNVSNSSYTLHDNHFMDVHLKDFSNNQIKSLFPSYDNYNVNAQGLSGLMKPRILKDINLYDRGKGDVKLENGEYIYSKRYLSSPTNVSGGSDYNIGGNKETHFYFENSLNSFLRINSGDIINSNGFTDISDFNVFNNINTEIDNTYSNSLTPEGNLKRTGLRKREGNFIEIFTNEQIKNNTVPDVFIEAKGINRINDNTFIDDGIGAYRITTVDGKTYHYSLPVYQFESFMKNFNDGDKVGGTEDVAFFESMKEKQYATHWLLTAITGPDYIDINGNGTLDEEDYGYWMEFEYGKWTDGYGWRTPKVGYHTIQTKDVLNDANDRYGHTYSWGRKQVYYLDAIRSRTHTALFVKELRDDSESYVFNYYNNKVINNNFDIDYNCKGFTSDKLAEFGYPYETFYKSDGSSYNLPATASCGTGCNFNVNRWYAHQTNFKYIDIPKNKSLGLSKILLIKNKDLSYNKAQGNITNILTGYCHFNNKYFWISSSSSIGGVNWIGRPDLYDKPDLLNSFQIHQHQNVLDVADIANQNLDAVAEKVIKFNYASDNTSLAQNTPNSSLNSKGRLSLNSLSLKGKEGVQLMPDYKFAYSLPSINYNANDIDDWGYNINNPNVWSLDEITTPLGSKIDIEYESDSFYTEAAYTEPGFEIVDEFWFYGYSLSSSQIESYTKDNDYITLYFKDGTFQNNLNTYYSLGETAHFTYNHYANDDSFLGYTYGTIYDSYIIDSMYQDEWIRFKVAPETSHHNKFPDSNSNCYTQGPVNYWGGPVSLPEGSICAKSIRVKLFTGGYTYNNPNGKLGGGLRVKNIKLLEGINTYKTNYSYSNLSNNNISGITSYFPSDEYPVKQIKFASELPAPSVMYEYVTVSSENNNSYNGKTIYKFNVLKPFDDYHSEPIEGSLFYRSEPLPNTLYEESYRQSSWMNTSDDFLEVSKATIYNNIAQIGRLESTKTYNGKNQLLNAVTNNYKSEFDEDGEIGVIQETFNNLRKRTHFNHSTLWTNYYYTSNSIVKYPSVLESTSTTQGGFVSTTYFNKYDFLTGQVLETITNDSKGNEFKTELIPAYTIPEYGSGGYSMGSKVDNPTNKNMLTQEAMTKTYLKVGTDWKETGVGITTWNNDWYYILNDGSVYYPPNDGLGQKLKVWRKHKTFVWDGGLNADGTLQGFTNTVAADDDENFVWTVGPDIAQTNPNWKNISTTTLYDHYSMPLEVKDINNNYAATKMCDDNSKVLTVSNAAFNEMFYSGAEYIAKDANGDNSQYFDGQVGIGDGYLWNHYGVVHTGVKAITIEASKKTFIVKPGKTKEYRASVWALNKPSGTIPTHYTGLKLNVGGTLIDYNSDEVIQAGDWVLLSFNAFITAGQEVSIVASSSYHATLDDFRLHPIASSMTSYVYNEWDELTYTIGSNGLATHYIYDAAGRLKEIQSEVIDNATAGITGGFKKAKEWRYTYKRFIEMDTNGNGVLDPAEIYGPLQASLSPQNGYEAPGRLTVNATTGSGSYRYSWATGSVTTLEGVNTINNFGTESTNNTRYVSTIPCQATSPGSFNAYVVKAKVRDIETNQTTIRTAYYHKSCSGGNGPFETPR